jgi:Flp pilus assembly protein TadG
MRNKTRAGNASVELLMLLPVLIAVIAAGVEFSMLLAVRQQLTAASREGARVAALGGDEQAVKDAVWHTLGSGNTATAEVTVVVPPNSGDPAEVWIQLSATAAVPDLLRYVGYSIRGETITVRTVMRKE